MQLTGVAFPIEVVLRVAMTFQLHPLLVAGRAVGERDVVIGDIVEEMHFFLLEEERGGDGVHGSVAPSLVEEAAVAVERVEVVEVGLRSEPVEVADFEVRPLGESCQLHSLGTRPGALTKWQWLYVFPPSSLKKPIELPSAICSGWALVKFFTLSHSVGIVSTYS